MLQRKFPGDLANHPFSQRAGQSIRRMNQPKCADAEGLDAGDVLRHEIDGAGAADVADGTSAGISNHHTVIFNTARVLLMDPLKRLAPSLRLTPVHRFNWPRQSWIVFVRRSRWSCAI